MLLRLCKRGTALFLALSLGLLCACGGPAPESSPIPSPSPPPPPSAPDSEEAEEEVIEVPEQPPIGATGWERPEVTMLVMNYDNGNTIEIPQLTWRNAADETPDGHAINQRILAFADGYQEYLDGHPQGEACQIRTAAYFINMYVVIVMQKTLPSQDGAQPETASFLYNYVREWEAGWEDVEGGSRDLEEMMGAVADFVSAEPGFTVEGCTLSGYAWTHYGSLFFWDVAVKNAQGESATLSLAYLEASLMEEPGSVLPGDEAFAQLREEYPDLPPDFDKV